MPKTPLKPCSVYGCPNLTNKRWCEQHAKEHAKGYERYHRDPETSKRYGRDWRRVRATYLAAQPLCELCLERGDLVPATDVHHLQELSQGGTNASDNLQSLCHSCHSRVGANWNK